MPKDPAAVRPWEIAPLRLAHLPAGSSGEPDQSGDPSPVLQKEPARRQAEEVLTQAREEAERLRQRAREEAERIRAGAAGEGFAEGQSRGREETAELERRLSSLLAEVRGAYERFCAAQVPDLVSLAATAAETLLHEQLSLEPERVITVVSQALEHVLASTRITLRLHPEDLELLQSAPAAPERRPSGELLLLADPTLERGGCRIDSDQGEVDATVSGRLARVCEALTAPS